MPEEIITAQTSGDNASQDGVAGAVTENEGGAASAEFTDNGENKGEGADGNENAEKPAQTKEQNSEFARRRREAERQRELKELRYKTIRETLGGKNPYTEGEIKDDADVEEYLTMKEISERGGDPVSDFAKFQKEKARESAKAAEEGRQSAEWYRNDRAEFVRKYPDVDINELISDEDFAYFAEGKVGKRPLAEIYERYLGTTGKKAAAANDGQIEKKAREAAAQMIANKKASVGTLSSSGATDPEFLSKEDVAKMSIAECEKNYDRIQKSMKHW